MEKMSDARARQLISVDRKLYQQQPNNILYAIHALQLAKEYAFQTPLWAQHAVENCYTDILNINSKDDHPSALMDALKIDGRFFKQFHEDKDLYFAAFDMMLMEGANKKPVAIYKQLAKKYPQLGVGDTLSKKLRFMLDVLRNVEAFPDPFSD